MSRCSSLVSLGRYHSSASLKSLSSRPVLQTIDDQVRCQQHTAASSVRLRRHHARHPQEGGWVDPHPLGNYRTLVLCIVSVSLGLVWPITSRIALQFGYIKRVFLCNDVALRNTFHTFTARKTRRYQFVTHIRLAKESWADRWRPEGLDRREGYRWSDASTLWCVQSAYTKPCTQLKPCGRSPWTRHSPRCTHQTSLPLSRTSSTMVRQLKATVQLKAMLQWAW